MGRHNFNKMKIWEESIELVSSSYKLTRTFPDFEKFNLISQMNRCAVSIPSNIAEEEFINLEKRILQIQKMIGSFMDKLD